MTTTMTRPTTDTIIAQAQGSAVFPTDEVPGYLREPDGSYVRNVRLVTYDAKLHWLEGNSRPYFSLTGEAYDGPRRIERRMYLCGAIADDLVALFPELAPIAPLHLSDDHGVPMHAVENGFYWLGFTKWVKWDQTVDQYGNRQVPREIAAKHFRISEDEATALHDDLVRETNKLLATDSFKGQSFDAVAKTLLSMWCDRQHPRWQAEADAALAAIERLGSTPA